MTLHICNNPADSLRENPPRFPDAMTLFTPEQIKNELLSLSKQLLPVRRTQRKMTDESWTALLVQLLECLGFSSENGSVTDCLLDSTTPNDRWLMQQLLNRAIAAVEYSDQCVDEQGAATGLLLPISYRTRIEWLLGFGKLPVAWVRTLDVLKF